MVALFLLTSFDFFETASSFFLLFWGLLQKGWIIKTLLFALLVGAIIEILEKSGSVDEFVAYMVHKKELVRSQRGVLMVSYLIGIVIFVESSITSLVSGAVGRALAKQYGVGCAKLAYVCDSTSAPVSSLLLFNGWGALLLGLLSVQIEASNLNTDSIDLLIEAVGYNFYAMSALVITFLVIYFGLYTPQMQQSDFHPIKKGYKLQSASYGLLWMVLPLVVLVGAVFFFLYLSGDGNILHGSGSSAIFYATLSCLAVMFFLYVPTKKISFSDYIYALYLGMKKLFLVVVVLLLAFGIGEVTTQLQTGHYLASYIQNDFDPLYLGAVVFLVSGLMAFATGTSWGTFSIMIPIVFPLALALDTNVALLIGAVISGGVFGDHCSPISDTTIISSLASRCDLLLHVKTQLPYAIVSGGVALVLFLIFSFWF